MKRRRDLIGLANRIALRLFTGGTGKHAERLLLEQRDGSNLGGWALGPARDTIWQELRRDSRNGRANG